MDLTNHWAGYTALLVFVLAYGLVIAEEHLHLRKSKPVMLAAGLIWVIIGIAYQGSSAPAAVEHAIQHFLVEFAQLFLFLLAAMTYVNAMTERGVFDALRDWLVRRAYSYRTLFWITGALSFCLSPMIDNLTTALVMCAVVLAVGRDNSRFVSVSCVNIVIAANAGGAFSPFGDITTLMVWQRGLVPFESFFALLAPSLVNYLVPAFFMSFAIPNTPAGGETDAFQLKRGAKTVLLLFAATVLTAVLFHSLLHIPPFLGMMTGLAYLKFFGYYLKRTHIKTVADSSKYGVIGDVSAFDSFREVARVEWDTLLFFFGIIMCVGGLGFIGYLAQASTYFYGELGPTTANILVGVMSAVIDNIPIMVAVLEMHPTMDLYQWLLVTFTAGVGGSLLSIGSAAGVALMGQARGQYTFFGHLLWTPVIALGYGAGVLCHMWLNIRYIGL